MRSKMNLTLGLVAALFTSYCGAGSPQNDSVRENEMLAMWELSTQSEEARERFEDGMREFDMQRDEEAYEHFKRAIAADPRFALAEAYAGFAASAAGSREGMFAHLKRAVELSANAPQTEKLIVEVIDKSFKGDDAGAIEAGKKLAALDQTPRGYWMLAYAYDASQQVEESWAALEKAIEKAPQFLAAYVDYSMILVQREPSDPVRGEQFARKAAELAPNEPAVYDALGDALRMQGKLEEAAHAYTKYAELDPTDGGGLQQRGHVNMFLGRYAEARADYDAAVALESGNRRVILALYSAFVSLQERNPKAALQEMEKLYASIDGSDVADPVGMKANMIEQGMFLIPIYHRMLPEAESILARYVALQHEMSSKINTVEYRRQSQATIAFAEGMLANAKGDYATAKAKAAQYIKIREPDNSPNKNRPAHELLGVIAHDEGRYADAIVELKQGAPSNMFNAYYLGLSYEKLGRMAEAEQMYQKIASYYLASPFAAVVRQDALERLKKITT